jgi:hypothetical protein
MKNKHSIGDIVTYIGSDDECNHECCKGFKYEVTHVYPPICGIYYYDMKTIDEDHDILEHDHYPKLYSVREYQVEV